ncbi:MAG: universal stress protein [Mycobacterium sp.]|nr:universal stress protein [Mycobacterium sp.]
MTARVVAWLCEGTWPAVVDTVAATRSSMNPTPDVVLLYVLDSQVSEAVHGAFSGLLGRGMRDRDPGTAVNEAARVAAAELLDAARRRLGGAAESLVRTGRIEREVVAACADAELLVCARDGDRSQLGPHSLGHHTRFVVDHAPCAVLLIWPDAAPGLGSMPPHPDDHPGAH